MARKTLAKWIDPLPKPKSKKQFAGMLYNLFGFLPPSVSVCPGHSAPLDVLWDIYAQLHNTYVIAAARKSGKTMSIAALQVLFALTYERLDSCDVAATRQQSSVCYEHSRSFLFNPQGPKGKFIIPKFIIDMGTKEEIMLRTGSRIYIRTGNLSGVNAIHPHKLFLDEVELMEGWHVIQEALLAPITQGDKIRQVVFISSWKVRGGLLEKAMETYKKDPLARIAIWCSFEAMQPIHDCSFCHNLKRTLSDGTEVTFAEFCKNPDGTCKGKRARGFMSLIDVRNNFLELEEDYFRAQWLSERPQSSGLKVFYIHPQSKLRRFALLPNYPVYAGLDYGRISALVLCQVLPTGHIVFFEEHIWYNLSPSQIVSMCKEIDKRLRQRFQTKIDTLVVDPRNYYIFSREFANSGLNAISPWSPTASYNSEKRARVAIVNNYLVPDYETGLPRMLFVANQTPNLLKQMEEMHYKMNSDGLPTEDLPDRNDHCSDAMLYVTSHLYYAGIPQSVEAQSRLRPEYDAILRFLQANVETYESDDAVVKDEIMGVPISELGRGEAERQQLVKEAVRRFISATVRHTAQQLGISAPQAALQEIEEKAYQTVEDYISSARSEQDLTDLVYKMPKELEEKLLQEMVRQLDALQMRTRMPYWELAFPVEMLYDDLMRGLGGFGGMGFSPW